MQGIDLYFAENGKVWSLGQVLGKSPKWLSYDIHNNFAVSDAENWSDTSAVYDDYFNHVLFSTGRRVWGYDETTGGWFLYTYGGSKVKVLGCVPPQQKLLVYDDDLLVDHVTILAEESLISDVVFQIDDDYLCKQYPRYFDGDTYAGGNPIKMRYETPWYNFRTDDKKNLRGLNIQATPNRTITIYYDYANAPRSVAFTEANKKTISIDSYGYGSCDLKKEYKWFTFAVQEESKDECNIYGIIPNFRKRAIGNRR